MSYNHELARAALCNDPFERKYSEITMFERVLDVGWQSFGEGHPHSIQLDNDTSATAANPMLVGLCIGGCVIVALVAFLLIYQCIKRRRSTLQKVNSVVNFTNFFSFSLFISLIFLLYYYYCGRYC